MPVMTVEVPTEDGDGEVSETFPAKKEVCHRCEGHGTHLTPSIGQHAYSSEEFEESFPEEEDRENYFRRGGIYDVTCEVCKGRRVVDVVDEEALTSDQKEVYSRYVAHLEEIARDEAEERAIMRMECGGYGEY